MTPIDTVETRKKMREILFRGMRTDTKEWVEGVAFPHDNNKVTMLSQHPMDGSLVGKEVDPETVGQFTGLTDKNGTKIFEGDIVRYNDTIHKVIFCTINGSAFFGITMPDRGEIWNFAGITCANKMEVIGNIYDNPELLKDGESE
jgi:uncharacterized phage protein (TIGR01671 family)